MDYAAELATLTEIELRHEDLLRHLEDLDNRVEQVLAEWQGASSRGGPPDQYPVPLHGQHDN